MTAVRKASAVAVALALGWLVSGCEFETFKGASGPAVDADDPGQNALPDTSDSMARFDTEGYFQAPAATAQPEDVERLLAGLPAGVADTFEEVHVAIEDFLAGSEWRLASGDDPVTEPVANLCFRGQGTVTIRTDQEEQRDGEWGDPRVQVTGQHTETRIFEHCAIPLYGRPSPDNGHDDPGNGVDIGLPIEPIEPAGLLYPAPAWPSPLILDGSTSRVTTWESLWIEGANETRSQDAQTITLVADLRGNFAGREHAYVFDGEATSTLTAKGWSDRHTHDYAGSAQYAFDIPRFETRWEPEPGDVRYLGRRDLAIEHQHASERRGATETFDHRITWSGQVAGHALNGFFILATPDPVAFRNVTELYEHGLSPQVIRHCPQGGVIRINDAELRFGGDTGVSGSVTQVVGGSGAAVNHSECPDLLDPLESLLDDLHLRLGG